MKALGVILLVGGGLYLLSRRQSPTGTVPMRSNDGWGLDPARGNIYDPAVYAGGSPSYAGSSGVGNTNPLTSILSSISTALAKATYRQPTGSAPISYGKPAGPAVSGGPSGNTGVVGPTGYLAAPLYEGALVDPISWYDTQPVWFEAATQAVPADIYSQNVSQEIYT